MRAEDLLEAAKRVATDAAGPAADDVDRAGRAPIEAIAAFRSEGLLGALVPTPVGGGASLSQASQMVASVATACASSGLVLAMHHIQVATVVRHGSAALRAQLLPALGRGEVLLANANSEVGLGGERRTSLCALEPQADGRYVLCKEASTVSYGEVADGVLATARRSPDSPPGDQVLAVCLPPTMELQPSGAWDTLGLRGTRSRPAVLRATLDDDHVIPDYADVFMRTSLPVSAVLLSSVWLGLAEAAAATAHRAVRAKARQERAGGTVGAAPPLAAVRLAELGVLLHQLREVVAGGAGAFDADKDTTAIESFRFSARMDNLKLSATTLVVEIAQRALGICGLAGYHNQSPTSMARIQRDAAAAPLMVNNDRALMATAQALLARKTL